MYRVVRACRWVHIKLHCVVSLATAVCLSVFANDECPLFSRPTFPLVLLQIMSPACLGLTYTYWEELYILVTILAVLVLTPFLHLFKRCRDTRRGSVEDWYAKLGGHKSGGLSKNTLDIFLRDYVKLSTKDRTSLDAVMAEHDVNNDGVIDSESHAFIVC